MSTIGKKPSRTGKATPPPWLRPVLTVAAALIVAALVVLLARWLRTLEPVQDFLTRYPGHSTLPQNAPVGFPAWMGWQHFLNMFLIVLIIRSGWQVRSTGRRAPSGRGTTRGWSRRRARRRRSAWNCGST